MQQKEFSFALCLGHRRASLYLVGLLLAAAILLLSLSGCGSANMGQTAETFKEAFVSQGLDKKGVARDDYVKETPYALADFQIGEIEDNGDNSLKTTVMATIENESFVSGLVYDAVFTKSSETDEEFYEFDLSSSSTTPKKGIDSGEGFDFEEGSLVVSDDRLSCEVTVESSCQAWFVDAVDETKQTFVFDGSAWQKADSEDSRSVTYKDIDGEYYGKTERLQHLTQFTISNLDPASGEFDIEVGFEDFPVDLWRDVFPFTATLHAVIDPAEGGEFALEDGYSYPFVATGKSSAGNGEALIKGCFVSSNDGSKMIELESDGYFGAHMEQNRGKEYAKEYDRNVSFDEGTLFKK